MERHHGISASLLLALCVLTIGCGQPPAPKSAPAAFASGQGFRSEFAVDKARLADSGENPYCILKPGYRLTFRDGKDTLTITVLDETKLVDGVKTRIVEERETKGGRIAEVSRNYFAIDAKSKDVYYFGEDVDEYKNDKVGSHGGSWQAGIAGATCGLMMPGTPKVGDKFYQERAPKVAMDRAEVVSLTERMTTPAGEFAKVLCTRETSALEAGSEKKWYAPGVGLLKDGGFVLVKVEKAK